MKNGLEVKVGSLTVEVPRSIEVAGGDAIDAYVKARAKDPKGPVLAGIPFASAAAGKAAKAAGLDAEAFSGRLASGPSGFTIEDVKGIAGLETPGDAGASEETIESPPQAGEE